MTVTDPSAVVTGFVEAIERQDMDAAQACLSDDCEYDNVPMGKVLGAKVIADYLGAMVMECSKVEWPVRPQAANGPVVFNERTDFFHLPHGVLEMPVTGVWEVHDGKITLWRDYFDLATYRNQMPKAD